MIISRTPFRISFFGGGTDFPVWYNENGGSVLSTTIDKYCYITCRYLPPYFDHKYRIRYTEKEETQYAHEINHPSVRECLRFINIDKGIEMIHSGDIPSMSGMGSSSSFTVGFLNVLYAMKGHTTTKQKLTSDALHVEQNLIKENVGSQDQVAASYGGFNRINFRENEDPIVEPVKVRRKKISELESSILLAFTGFSRYSSDIASEHIKQVRNNHLELKLMKEMVDESLNILNDSERLSYDFGKLLHESWLIKKSLTNKITNSDIDDIYSSARRAGAIGGKLCGAGAGGFMMFVVPPELQSKVKEALKKLIFITFKFEDIGSHIIFSSNE